MSCQAPDRIYAQYRDKPNALAWYDITHQIGDPICDVFEQIRRMYNIDLNSGEQLDIIGRVIVESREFIANTTLTVYECNSVGDNECGDPSIQCSATSIADDSELSDQYFRLLLKSKIIKNNSETTIYDILDAVSFIAPDIDILRVNDGEDMSFSIEFYGLADPIVRDLLLSGKIVPKPQGVRFNGFLEGYNYAQCGDSAAQCNADGDYECVGFIGV
jgi:hypothetical protein